MALELPVHRPLTDKETTGSAATASDAALSIDDLQELGAEQAPINEVLLRLGTNLDDGLSSAEAARRLALYGSNELEKKGRTPLILLFLSQFLNLLIVILIIAAVVSIIVGDIAEGIAVIVTILITVGLSTFSEYSSGNALEALSQLTDPHTHVFRDGKLSVIRTPEIVPGDIIQLSPGDLVPADARIIEAHSAKVNEMILTGESADVAKKDKVSSNESSAKLTSVNMVYSSTSVVEGRIKVFFTLY
jgi:Ca2+-transporting ATPase